MAAQRTIRRFAKKLEGDDSRTSPAAKDHDEQDRIRNVTQKFSGFEDAPAHSPASWWQKRKERKERHAQERNAGQKSGSGDEEMPKKDTREKLDEIFHAKGRGVEPDDEEDDGDRPDVYADDIEEDDDDEPVRRPPRKSWSGRGSSSVQKSSKQHKCLKEIEQSIRKKEQDLARLMKEEKAEREEIKKQKKELKEQRKTLHAASPDARSGVRNPIITGFLMACGFLIFFVLIAGIAYAVTLATGRPFNEFIRLVIKV